MIAITNPNANADTRLNHYRMAASPIGSLLAGLRDRLTPQPNMKAAKNLDAWNALKVTLAETHGRSGALAMRALRDDYTQGKPLTAARIKGVLSRADAYAAAQKLLTMQAPEGRALSERDVARAVKTLRDACAKAAKANPGTKTLMTPEAVIDGLVRDLPPSQIKDISSKSLRLATELIGNFSQNRTNPVARRWTFTKTDGALVEFASQSLLLGKLEKTNAVETVSELKTFRNGLNGDTYMLADNENKVYKPFVFQTIGGKTAGAQSAIESTFSVDGALSAARAIGSDRVAQLFDCTELVPTQLAIRSDNTSHELGILMDKALSRHLSGAEGHQAIERARPALARLQMVDWICGQLDRHLNNVSIGQDGSVKAFDNDDAFGHQTQPGRYMGCALTAPPPMIDTTMRANLERLVNDPQRLRNSLSGILDEAAIDATVTRMNLMWDDVTAGRISVVEPNEWPRETFTPNLVQKFPGAAPEPVPYRNVTSYATLYHHGLLGSMVFQWRDPMLSKD